MYSVSRVLSPPMGIGVLNHAGSTALYSLTGAIYAAVFLVWCAFSSRSLRARHGVWLRGYTGVDASLGVGCLCRGRARRERATARQLPPGGGGGAIDEALSTRSPSHTPLDAPKLLQLCSDVDSPEQCRSGFPSPAGSKLVSGFVGSYKAATGGETGVSRQARLRRPS